MSEIVLSAIQDEIATLSRIVDVPSGPLGYGKELACVTDITETLDEVDPFSEQGIWEAAIRRITTNRGELPDGGDPEDREYGRNVRRLLHRGLTPAEIRDEAGQLQAEIAKDDRVAAVEVTLAQESRSSIRLQITITPHPPGLPFSRIVVVTPETLEEL